MKKFIPIFIAAAALFAACGSDDTPGVVNIPAPQLSSSELATVNNIDGFDLDFFKAMNTGYTTRNLVVSPLSASMNLSLLANVSDVATRAQICDVLGSADVASLNSLTAKYMSWLPAADIRVGLKIANSVWYDKTYSLKPSFSELAGKYYSADIFARDFSDSSLAGEINGWVSGKTAGLIDRIVEPYELQMSIAMNINTLYFNGEWSDAFDSRKTEPEKFRGTEGSVTVPMMNAQRVLPYLATETFEAVELGFGSSLFSTVLILPSAESDVNDLIASDALSTLSSRRWLGADVDLTLPKFSLKSDEMNLTQALKALGIDGADRIFLQGLFADDIPGSYTGGIAQKTSVEFSEKGAEAAAVTWEPIFGSAGDTSTVRQLSFDRPFIFLIRENYTGRCLFAGKVMNL